MKIKILIITHEDLGGKLLETAQKIMGELKDVETFSVYRSDNADYIKINLKAAIKRITEKSGLIILTDMLGGTPTNFSLPYISEKKVEVVTGVNLPMLIACVRKKERVNDLKELANKVEEYGKKGIINCSKQRN
ncbi:MAG: PTS sugar transporter subunit IIA [Elusimicrobiota bacterium]